MLLRMSRTRTSAFWLLHRSADAPLGARAHMCVYPAGKPAEEQAEASASAVSCIFIQSRDRWCHSRECELPACVDLAAHGEFVARDMAIASCRSLATHMTYTAFALDARNILSMAGTTQVVLTRDPERPPRSWSCRLTTGHTRCVSTHALWRRASQLATNPVSTPQTPITTGPRVRLRTSGDEWRASPVRVMRRKAEPSVRAHPAFSGPGQRARLGPSHTI